MKKYALEIIVFLAFALNNNLPVLAVRTNVNEVNDLFDRNIENKEQLMRDVNDQREGAVRQIEAGNGLEHIEGINEAEGKARELESIREVDLESSGRQKRVSKEYRFYDENELEPDYSKPGNLAHKRDADEIIAQTGLAMHKLGKDLQAKLSALGIDCHQVKGSVQKDLTYHIEISGEEHKNSEYEQIFCEEPRNRYNCHDVLTTRCKRRGAVGELKYIVRMTWYNAVGYLGFYGRTKLGYESDFFFSRDGEIDLSPFFPEIKRIMNKRPLSLSLTAAFETIDVDKIILPPQRYIPYKITLQQRNGEWIEKDFRSLPLFQGGLPFPIFYYNEGCVEWVDEWDEVCGLES